MRTFGSGLRARTKRRFAMACNGWEAERQGWASP